MSKRLQLFLVIAMSSATLYAGGFQINEHGARAMAMAGAFTGLANDASAVYFNPAGITQLKGTHFSAGTTLIIPTVKFTGISGDNSANPFITASAEYKIKSKVFTPINFYYSQQITEDLFVGLAVNNPYGLGTDWDTNWPGRYIAGKTEVRTFFFNPVIAYKISDKISVSAGFVYAYGDVTITKNLALADPVTHLPKADALVSLEGDGTAIGYTAGVLFTPTENTSVGISFKSEAKFEFEGTATTTPATLDFVHPLAGNMSTKLPYGDITAELTTPMNVTVGFAYKTDCTTYTGDIQWIGWSSYDTLAVDFKQWVSAVDGTSRTAAAREYKNTYIFRLGAEHKMSDVLTLRGGILYDLNPVPDKYVEPTLPDADRLGLSIGCGYKLMDNLSVDFGYLFLLFMEREISETYVQSGHLISVPFTGKYNSYSHLIALNLNYAL